MGHYFSLGFHDNPSWHPLVLVVRFRQSLLLTFGLLGHKKFTINRDYPKRIDLLIKLLDTYLYPPAI
jgi:hypothetical protein